MDATMLERGRKLARLFLSKSTDYHVKSDQHEILGYEAAILDAHLDFTEKGTAIPEHLMTSCLLGRWGSSFFSSEWSTLKAKARDYYTEASLKISAEQGDDAN